MRTLRVGVSHESLRSAIGGDDDGAAVAEEGGEMGEGGRRGEEDAKVAEERGLDRLGVSSSEGGSGSETGGLSARELMWLFKTAHVQVRQLLAEDEDSDATQSS
jgi:hypothetical protein